MQAAPGPVLARALAVGATLMALAWLARLYLVEPTQIAHACTEHPWQGICGPRMALILTFRDMGLGWLALAGAGWGLFSRRRLPAWIALCAGSLGLVLYCYEFAAVGAIAGLLLLLRR